MPLVQTRGAASAQGFGEFAQQTAVNYIEDVFSAYIYTGTGAALTITNGIDLSTKGGLVWVKDRAATGSQIHQLTDSAVGITKYRQSATTAADTTAANQITAFNTNGFSLGAGGNVNQNAEPFASWTFRKQPKFFDVVAYTGTGVARTIAHNLGATPGFVIVKRTDTTGAWYCNVVAMTGWTDYMVLNTTAARATDSTVWNSTSPTSTTFAVGTNAGVNANGGTYVAYLFANSAGGFGLLGTDSVISTTLVSSAGSGNTTVNLGWEPQFLMLKKTASTSDWFMYDNMRGMTYTTGAATLLSNTNGVETTGIVVSPTAEGFTAALDNSFTYFCLAIRRGPMKVPTLGTDVYNAIARTGTGATATVSTVGFPPDAALITSRNKIGTPTNNMFDRLRGAKILLSTNATTAEITDATTVTGFDLMTGVYLGDGSSGRVNYAYGSTFINWFFRRAPSFMDVVCYTGTGSATTFSHNLQAVPELMIVKGRNTTFDWYVYHKFLGATKELQLNLSDARSPYSEFYAVPTSSVFSVSSDGGVNQSGATYINYLFATCAGVSKVGSYTGNGTTQTIDCGFGAGGARFVLIKRTDATGDWYVYDTARGMTVLTDPYLWLNSTVAEVASLGSVTAVSTGFALNAAIVAAINVNAGTYIFLAIA